MNHDETTRDPREELSTEEAFDAMAAIWEVMKQNKQDLVTIIPESWFEGPYMLRLMVLENLLDIHRSPFSEVAVQIPKTKLQFNLIYG
ncbi:hypothetical protein KAR91_84245, partial [Candidatus Pacearchaeota archaeon]|nr:hypothetical protein [Candidatus Pacearchaeota archaeon]